MPNSIGIQMLHWIYCLMYHILYCSILTTCICTLHRKDNYHMQLPNPSQNMRCNTHQAQPISEYDLTSSLVEAVSSCRTLTIYARAQRKFIGTTKPSNWMLQTWSSVSTTSIEFAPEWATFGLTRNVRARELTI